MNTTIFLIRHAAYENPGKIFHGRLPGFPLSETGRLQATKLAKALQSKPVVAVYSSPLSRAYETATAIAGFHNLSVITDQRLLDIRTPLQGKPIPYMESIGWNFFRRHFILQGGERLSEIYSRMDAAIRDILHTYHGGCVVAVSHGDPIMAVKCKYLGWPLRSRRIFAENYVPLACGYCIAFVNNSTVSSIEPISP